MKNWEEKKLGEVCSIGDGNYSSKYPKASEFVSEGIPFLTATNLKNGTVIPDGIRFISKEQHSTLIKGHVIQGDLVIVVRGSSTGNNSIVPEEYEGSNLNSQLAFLRVKEGILTSEFLFAVFNSPNVMKKVKAAISGAAQPQLPNNKLLEIKISYPTIGEQKRIVSILDEAFEAIATAKTNAEQNLKNAKELFESCLQGVFENKGEDWEERTLDELCKNVTVGFVGKMVNKYKETGIPFLRSQNIKPHQIDLKDVIYIDQLFNAEIKKSQLSPGDLAIVRTGYPGTAAVIPESLPVSNCSDIVIVKVGNKIDPFFLCYFFNSTYGKKLVLGNIVGAAQKHFNVGAAKRVKIPVPSIEEQHIINIKLDALSAETKRLEAIYQKKITDLEELKKSVLQKAFNGELKTN